MNGYKSKHVSMPGEMYDRVFAMTERLGCSFSKLIQIALDERLPQWEAEIGGFQIKGKPTFEEMIDAKLEEHKTLLKLARLKGITAPFVARD